MDRTRIVIVFGIVIVLISLALLFFFSPLRGQWIGSFH